MSEDWRFGRGMTFSHILTAQSLAMLLSARTWWQVWHCPCEPNFQDAALWTGLTMSQGVVLIAILMLRSRQERLGCALVFMGNLGRA